MRRVRLGPVLSPRLGRQRGLRGEQLLPECHAATDDADGRVFAGGSHRANPVPHVLAVRDASCVLSRGLHRGRLAVYDMLRRLPRRLLALRAVSSQ